MYRRLARQLAAHDVLDIWVQVYREDDFDIASPSQSEERIAKRSETTIQILAPVSRDEDHSSICTQDWQFTPNFRNP